MTGLPSVQFAFGSIVNVYVFPSEDCVHVAIRGWGSPVLGSCCTRVSYKRPAALADGSSLMRTGFRVLISALKPSMTRPPATGFSPCDGDGEVLPVSLGVHAVTIRLMAAEATISTRAVRFDFMPLCGSFPNARIASLGKAGPGGRSLPAIPAYGRR